MSVANPLPRWRGFNLPEMFVGPADLRWAEMIRNPRGRFARDDFAWIRDWGFDFVRLPVCYKWWTRNADDPFAIDDAALAPIDDAITCARELGLHVSLCLHHAPGYAINPLPAPEPFDLWTDDRAADCFAHHWRHLATRFRAVPSSVLDFDLLNEPARCTSLQYARVALRAIDAIRSVTPDRLIISDGVDAGNVPCEELIASGVAQSCRGYEPSELTHYLAWWAGMSYVKPSWPQRRADGSTFGEAELRAKYAPWRELTARGVGVLCGEFGCNNRTPHDVVLRFTESLLSIFREMNIGWALWNFRGSFGVLDSGRSDVDYADWRGVPLDHELLELLQRY
jgi:endoglucanase